MQTTLDKLTSEQREAVASVILANVQHERRLVLTQIGESIAYNVECLNETKGDESVEANKFRMAVIDDLLKRLKTMGVKID